MATLRNRIASLESTRLPRASAVVHLAFVRSEAEEIAETERLAREAPGAEHVLVRLMNPGFAGWPAAAMELEARRRTLQ